VKFIDLFAGCGGLSLGLSYAGMQGSFAIEKDPMAFRTFAANFLASHGQARYAFDWPRWLEARAWSIHDLIDQHSGELARLHQGIDVIAGGPPCQGFSFAGRRREADPRNELFQEYVRVVKLVRPSALILENVPGMKIAHATRSKAPGESASQSYFEKLREALAADYEVQGEILDPVDYGVPQRRPRLIVIGLRRDLALRLADGVRHAFHLLQDDREFREDLLAGLQVNGRRIKVPVTAKAAISDLSFTNRRWDRRKRQPHVDEDSPHGSYEEVVPGKPSTPFQKLMNAGHDGQPLNSMRLARHREEIVERFTKILASCDPGVQLRTKYRERFGLLKQRVYPMDGDAPSPTITTLPDDIIHYADPRILTVRECARLQSFPDWFVFRGKYTTGGHLRTKECPRYTQVGNAVPPLLGRAIGMAIRDTLHLAQASATVVPSEQLSSAPQLHGEAAALV
jgi:DNA (cytosine-5)-methyltransferase 1